MSSEMIITISRRPGCGGVEIGQRLARRLRAVYIDKKTVSRAAEGLEAVLRESGDTGSAAKFWQILGQTPILYDVESYIPEIRSIVSDSPVSEREEQILLELAGEGPAVILGRAGFHRFRNHPGALHFFLGADQEYRLSNYMRLYRLKEDEARELLHATDLATERYIRKVTGKDMLDLRNYDLAMDVGKIDFNQAIEVLLDYIHARTGKPI
jgi:cytidylate kinase